MTVEAWGEEELGRILDGARDRGETVEVGVLRSEMGLGHEDLMELLSHVREAGGVVESAPGEWRRPFEDELQGADDGPEPPELSLEEAERAAGAQPAREVPPRRPAPVAVADPETGAVRLTMGVAAALDAETMGKIVAAGIEEAKEAGRAFVLRVEP